MWILKLFAAGCNQDGFFGFPTWYKYLRVKDAGQCTLDFSPADPNDLARLGLGIADIMLRLGGMIAFGFVIYGGFIYMTSQGEPDRTKRAKDILIGSIVGLVIVILATPIVSFIGGSL